MNASQDQGAQSANNADVRNSYMEGAVAPGEVYTLPELEALPTLAVGQADDLKVDAGNVRIWLSRCGVEDGEPCDNKVTVEQFNGQRWIEVGWYEAASEVQA